jgi:nucleoside-diphosphate-sugar epimerase
MSTAEGGLLTRMINQALTGAPVLLPGRGAGILAPCFVDDLVEGLIALMAAPAGHRDPVDLGSPRAVSTLDLARMIVSLAGSGSPVCPGPEPDTPPPSPADLTLARALGWAPKVPLETGLLRTLEHQAWLRRYPGPAARQAP